MVEASEAEHQGDARVGTALEVVILAGCVVGAEMGVAARETA